MGNSVKQRSGTHVNCLKLCFKECRVEMGCVLSIFTDIVAILKTIISGIKITLSHNLKLQRKGFKKQGLDFGGRKDAAQK